MTENTIFFSYDEMGVIFFNEIYELMNNTPRCEDCYVYIGKHTKKDIKNADWDEIDDYRSELTEHGQGMDAEEYTDRLVREE
tara:strand:- start:1846 stop:2091 length:246 start_codon:yes stop_codon:yes gene_type:complete